jgi:hypothetical protein
MTMARLDAKVFLLMLVDVHYATLFYVKCLIQSLKETIIQGKKIIDHLSLKS